MVENDGFHAQKDAVAQGRTVDHTAMTNGAVLADGQGSIGIQMQHTVVLNVGAPPNKDGSRVSANHAVVPDARALTNSNVAYDIGSRGDKDIVSNTRPYSIKGQNRHVF